MILTDSGTTALSLALRLAVAERPGPVALPAYCCYDIATATDAAQVEFVLYDIDPATLGPDPESLRAALDRGARVVVVVHLYGIPVDLSSIKTLTAPADVIIIEDAAQGVGARLNGQPVGSFGRYAVLSFGRGKGMTGGRGGALLANAPDAAARLTGMGGVSGRASGSGRDAALLLAQWVLARPSLYGVPLSLPFLRLGETIYREPTAPAAPSGFALGTLTRTLHLGEAEAKQRRVNAAWLLQRLPGNGLASAPRMPTGAIPGFLRLPLLVDPAALSRFKDEQLRSVGVWRGYPTALPDLKGFGSRRRDPEHATPGARILAERLFTLPTHGLLNDESRRALAVLLAPTKD